MDALRIPVATYRVQFNRQFGFTEARKLVPYLSRLGISDLYVSPVLKARRGSAHGYDVVDPTQLNPELGSEADFDALARTLKEHDMGLVLDIVPNHLAASSENFWWTDVLENGPASPYADFFDIDWEVGNNRLILPLLATPYRTALENRQFILARDEAGFFVQYQNYRLPLNVRSYRQPLSHRLGKLEAALGASHPDFQSLCRLLAALEQLPPDSTPAGEGYRARQALKEDFRLIVERSPAVRDFLRDNIALFNGRRGRPESFGLMQVLLGEQTYRLEFWRKAREQLNYRRFFDINDLAGIRVEAPPVFAASHVLILRLIREGKVTGLRIDHIDGLNDPGHYLAALQRHIAPETAAEVSKTGPLYVVVEKILAGDEALPPDWPMAGTTGYDFASTLNALFIDPDGASALDGLYKRFTGSQLSLADLTYEKKKQVIEELFPSEVRALGRRLADLACPESGTAELLPAALAAALIEVTACLPVYRTYTRTPAVPSRDRPYLEQALAEARRRRQAKMPALDFLERVLTLDFPPRFTTAQKKTWLDFVRRWQQWSGAVMAKGFEDTVLYSYSRLLSLNEVGGDPDSPGLSIGDFHRFNRARLSRWPYTMNATSTHDTKRSQDVRARINVLSEIPGEWEAHLYRWHQENEPAKTRVNGRDIPDPETEMLLYQTLLGAWPLRCEEVPEFKERLKAYLIKAVREAKVHTGWLSPDPEYESALITFLDSILAGSPPNGFLTEFLPFARKLAYYGMLNSLSQALLKVTCPGVPDFYQGTELWDFSLVDPDNRRPVDFALRRGRLAELNRREAGGQKALARQLLNSWQDGRLKLYVTTKALSTRSYHKDLFRDGQYLPLKVAGDRANHMVAFARRKDAAWALTVTSRLMTKLATERKPPVGKQVWGDDRLIMPDAAPQDWHNVLTGENLNIPAAGRKELAISDVLSVFPLALLVNTW